MMRTIRKYALLVVTAIGSCLWNIPETYAQEQELEQLALNIEKLAQFKQILSQMKNGYQTLNNGYSTIKGLSEGNFNLHDLFLKGLLKVNPRLRSYSRVADIIRSQGQLLSEYQSAYARFKKGGRFTAAELSYMGSVYNNLFEASLRSLDELSLVLTDSELRMSDDERLKQIDRIDAETKQRLSFLRVFNRKAADADALRQRTQQDAANGRILSGQRH
ncbi:hypothetical protein SAMN04488511_11616 [Pedobacter suwonensis]|uniref:TerB family tellurite resistance protein n=2 Tax=Pedobacter suwonensis TaxID=332999 RepID=A0A1I0TXN3_9SPHI|nr:hypothetical protein SAMN04488511_11616 [Pedobacter suwonensis]